MLVECEGAKPETFTLSTGIQINTTCLDNTRGKGRREKRLRKSNKLKYFVSEMRKRRTVDFYMKQKLELHLYSCHWFIIARQIDRNNRCGREYTKMEEVESS